MLTRLSRADLAPTAVGVNVTVMVQPAPGATCTPMQVWLVTAKSAAPGPLKAMALTSRGAVPLAPGTAFETVIVIEADDPVGTVGNAGDDGLTLRAAATPVPLSGSIVAA